MSLTFIISHILRMMATNYVGPFFLTQMLLPLLKNSPFPSRIVNVSSFTHRCGKNFLYWNDSSTQFNLITMFFFGNKMLVEKLRRHEFQHLLEVGYLINYKWQC